MSDIFLSYATEDRERIRQLVDALEASGRSVWWDRRIPAGRAYAEVIEAAIKDAKCMLVVWTKASVESEWVREEADRGKRRRRLVPVRLDDVEPPLGFGQIQAADLVDWDGTRTAPGFQQLLADIASILGPPPTAGGATASAEWQTPADAAPTETIGAIEASARPSPTEAIERHRAAAPSPRRRRVGRRIGAILVGLAIAGIGGYWYLEHQRESERLAQAQREQQRLDTLRAREEREARLAEERRQAEEAAREKERLAALREREQQEAKLAEERRRAEEAAREKERLAALREREQQEAKRAEEKRQAEEAAREKERLAALREREQQEARAAEEKRRAEEAARPPEPAAARTPGIGGIEQQRQLAAEIGWPDRVRCFGYDPASLHVGQGPNRDLAVIANNFQLARAENAADADMIMRIARAHHAQCMIGLNGHAPGGRQWVFVFWERGTAPTLPGEGCDRYDPRRLDIRNQGQSGWALISFAPQLGDPRPLHFLNDEADARVALAYARKHSALCFIGQYSKDQDAYLVRYWKR